MIAAVALVPAAPALLAALTGPDAADLRPLREAVAQAVAHVLSCGPRRVFVVAGRQSGTLAGFGAPTTEPPPTRSTGGWTHELGERLLRESSADISVDHVALPDDPAGGAELARAFALRYASSAEVESALVLADGSATRGPRSPMGDDPEGEQFDTSLSDGVRSGAGPAATTAAAQVFGCSGLPGLAFFSALDLSTGPAADVLYEAAPTGVGYIVALRPCRLP